MSKQTFTTGQILTAAQMTTLQANDYNWTVNAKTTSYTLVATDAGTRITMTSASATTITVNTSLFTAGDVLEIINLGAGVCTITAGTATVSTSATLALKQYDAGSLFFNSTSAAVFFSADAADNTSPLTTKGDLYTYSTTDTRLAVGNNGETLVADSSASVGLRYSATPSASNPVINSAFQVWQRGTTFTNTNGYTADRWYKGGNTPHTFSRQATNDTTNLPFIQYCLRAQRDSGSSATGIMQLANMFETVNSIPYAGKTVTFSFYARAGANYSPTSSALSAQVRTGTGTDQNLFSGYTGSATPITVSATLTTTWQRFQGSATLSSSATEMCVYFESTPTGTASTNDYFEVTGVQLDIGSVALPFRTQNSTIQGETSACQRYFEQYDAASGQVFYTGFQQTSTAPRISLSIAPKRTTPTITYTGTLQVMVTGGTTYNATSIDAIAYAANSNTLGFRANIAAGGTAGDACALYSSGAVSILYSAEL